MKQAPNRQVTPECRDRVRVFVSSTFQDMQAERNALVSRVFPLLVAHCRARRVEFVGVDLRWGITADQAERGETVPICLGEIDRCRPYFIGMLGERYGWVPDGADVSVTEKEIRYGAPTGEGERARAFFYLRDRALSEALCGAHPADPRQEALKAHVRASGYPVLDGYAEIDAFADRTLSDLTAAIDEDFPESPPVSPLEAEREAQRYYAKLRAAHFFGREEELAALEAHAARGGLLLVVGAPGMGKSALAARWALDRPEGEYLFVHFAGSSSDRGWEHIARRLIAEMIDAFRLDLALPDDREGLRRALPLALSMAAAGGRRVSIVLDGADAIASDDHYGFSWFPETLPEGVNAVFTLCEGEQLSRLRLRAHEELPIAPLGADVRRSVAREYLRQYAKSLDREQTRLLSEAPQTGNPMYLITLLSEIRHVGKFEDLTGQIGSYLACGEIGALFTKILARFEADYDPPDLPLTGRALRLLYAARGGLTERELLALLGVPQAVFAPLHLALEPFTLVSRGAVTFAHDSFRAAVRDRYLSKDGAQDDVRRELADWYRRNPDEPRRSYELPWLMERCGDWNGLFDALAEPETFFSVWDRNRFELKSFWADAAKHTGRSRAEGYADVLARPEAYRPELVFALASLLAESGEPAAAEPLLGRLIARAGRDDCRTGALAHGLRGNLCHAAGNLKQADAEYRAMYELACTCRDRYQQQRALGNIGLIAQMRGRLDEAEDAFLKTEALARELYQRDGLQITLGNRGNLRFARGDPAGAKTLYLEQERVCRDSGNLAGIIHSLGALGMVALREGDLEEAGRRFSEQESVSRGLGAPDGLQNALGNLAAIALARGDEARAEALWTEKLEICRRADSFLGEQNALGNLARLYLKRGEPDRALPLAEERAGLCKKNRALPQYADALHALACAQQALGRPDAARQSEWQAYALARQNGFSQVLSEIRESKIIACGGN